VAPLKGREICVRYEPAEDGTLMGITTIAGGRRPELDEPVLWIKPTDGYSLAH
jgi:hypothetical protein